MRLLQVVMANTASSTLKSGEATSRAASWRCTTAGTPADERLPPLLAAPIVPLLPPLLPAADAALAGGGARSRKASGAVAERLRTQLQASSRSAGSGCACSSCSRAGTPAGQQGGRRRMQPC